MSTTDMDRDKLGELLSAYVDGELDAQETELVERVVQEDEDARRLLDELRRTASLVSSLPRHAAPGSIADDLRLQLERSELLGDVPAPRTAPGSRRSSYLALLSMAAAIAFLVVGGLWIVNDRNERGAKLRDRVVTARPVEEREKSLGESDGAKRTAARKDMATRSSRETGIKSGKRGRRAPARAARRASTHTSKPARSVVTSRESVVAKHEAAPVTLTQPGRKRASTGSLADAAVERKLAAGFPPDAFQSHPFSNETFRLRVTVADETKRDAAEADLTQYLLGNSIADLSTRGYGANRSARLGAVESFFLRGKQGVNFDRADERQILVRASARELDGLLTQLADATDNKEDVTLISGPSEVVVRGVDEARRALSLAQRERVAKSTRSNTDSDRVLARTETGDAQEKTKSAPGPTAASRGLLEVMRGLGLDPDRLHPPTESVGGMASKSAQPSQPAAKDADAIDSTSNRSDVMVVADAEETRDNESSSLPKSDSSGRRSLVDRRTRALDMALQERSREKRSAQPPGSAGSLRGRHPSMETKAASSATGIASGESNEAERYVTLVVELVVAKPTPSRNIARPARTNPAGTARKAKTKPAHR